MDTNGIIRIFSLGFPWKTQDPFLFCVHHEDHYPRGNANLGPDVSLSGRNLGNDFVVKDGFRMYHGEEVPGFPAHPHRGFETVTIVRKGLVDHSDSLGAYGRFGDGDVQWMTAGKGIQHAEMFPLLRQDDLNPFELFQIWLNLPSKNKFAEPHYKMLWAEDIPVLNITDEKGKRIHLEVVAGSIEGRKAVAPPPESWASDSKNEVSIWYFDMEAGAEWTLPAAGDGLTRSLYFFQGTEASLNDQGINPYHGAELASGSSIKIKNGNESGRFLMLQGRPILEPVAQYGPFVMNTQTEIREAMMDYQRTSFGGWPWNDRSPVHGKEYRRFAHYADGKEEVKG
jgi:redox-sensitive bicupin YhaK (pirin superfamily)